MIALILCAAACHPAATKGPSCRPTPSGLAVPRYVSLKKDSTPALAGPGPNYRILWVYRAKGLPLLIIQETLDWRRVRDPDGQLAWVHKSALDGVRTVMRTEPSDLQLRDRAASDGRVKAVLTGHSIAVLDVCRGAWCKVTADQISGWAPKDALWGAEDPPIDESCRKPT
jgi:SH3-like domain-containing protein